MVIQLLEASSRTAAWVRSIDEKSYLTCGEFERPVRALRFGLAPIVVPGRGPASWPRDAGTSTAFSALKRGPRRSCA